MSVRLLRISAFCALGAFLVAPNISYAGFEWVAPQKNTQMMQGDYAESATYTSPSIDMDNASVPNSMAVPAVPVLSESLNTPILAPAPVVDMPNPVAPSMPINGGRAQGFIIDPYPMTKSGLNPQYRRDVSGDSIQKAMNEEADIAHPMQLGANMSTMTQPVRIASVSQKIDRPFNPSTIMTPLPNGMTAPEMPSVEYSDAVGFGRDLPLALALSQVVPDDYAFGFADDKVAGEIVTWQGGKPWDQVLNDMLADQGLRAIIQGKKVTITAL